MTGRSAAVRSDQGRCPEPGSRPRPPTRGTSRRGASRRAQAIAVCSTLALTSVLAAGCGGAAGPGVASLGPTSTTTRSIASGTPSGNSGSPTVQLRYVECIQVHGVPDFPDPGPGAVEAMRKIDLSSPQFGAAMRACRKLLPKEEPVAPGEAAKVQAEALKFATCMRAHGMTHWPDPQPGGGYMVALAGAAANSPVYRRASKACHPLLPKG